MFDVLQSTYDREKAIDAVSHLIFKKKYNPKIIADEIENVDDLFDPQYLVDDAAKNHLSTLYINKPRSNITMPPVLLNWNGDFRESTEKIYEIARGEITNEIVESYQKEMRAKLPQKIPLVRGTKQIKKSKNRPLRSWSACVGTARIYGDVIQYTVVNPSDIFMCSKYGEYIGEQEYVLTNYSVSDTYPSTLKNHIKLYQKMDKILR